MAGTNCHGVWSRCLPDYASGATGGDDARPPGGRTPNEWFNISNYAVAASNQAAGLATGGDVGLQTITAPPTKTMDFSLFKNFRLTERVNMQFRARGHQSRQLHSAKSARRQPGRFQVDRRQRQLRSHNQQHRRHGASLAVLAPPGLLRMKSGCGQSWPQPPFRRLSHVPHRSFPNISRRIGAVDLSQSLLPERIMERMPHRSIVSHGLSRARNCETNPSYYYLARITESSHSRDGIITPGVSQGTCSKNTKRTQRLRFRKQISASVSAIRHRVPLNTSVNYETNSSLRIGQWNLYLALPNTHHLIPRYPALHLPPAPRPLDLDLIHLRGPPESEVQPQIALRKIASSASDFRCLHEPARRHSHPRANRAAVRLHAFQLQFDPMVRRLRVSRNSEGASF